MAQPILGQIKLFGGDFAPAGYAFCNGQLLPISQNEALFSILGTTYGGDGRTNFALPNLQERIPIHYGNGAGLTSRSLGEIGGSETEVLSSSQIPRHTHTLVGTHCPAKTGDPGGHSMAQAGYQNRDSNLVSMASQAMQNTGGNQPHLNMQPYTTLNFIIALEGSLPSRN